MKESKQIMLATLQRSFRLKKEYNADHSSDLAMNDYEVVARLYYLINRLSEKQQNDLLRQFLNGNAAKFLVKTAIDMSEEQRFVFMKHLEEMQAETGKNERRKHFRKDCLINVNFKIRGRKFNSYILDISNAGAFIETGESFSKGLKMVLNFSSPENRRPLDLIGEIIWVDSRGIGVRFCHLTRDQTQILNSFCKKNQEILEINS